MVGGRRDCLVHGQPVNLSGKSGVAAVSSCMQACARRVADSGRVSLSRSQLASLRPALSTAAPRTDFLPADRIEELERLTGQACLAALARTQLQDSWGPHNGSGPPVWVA